MNVHFTLSEYFRKIRWSFLSEYSVLQFIRESDYFEVNSNYSGFRFDIKQYSFDVYIKQSSIYLGIYRDSVLISKHNDCNCFDISILDDRVIVCTDWKHSECFHFQVIIMSIVISKDDSFQSILTKLVDDGFNISYAEINVPKGHIKFTVYEGINKLKIVIYHGNMTILSSCQFGECDVVSVKINNDMSFEVIQ